MAVPPKNDPNTAAPAELPATVPQAMATLDMVGKITHRNLETMLTVVEAALRGYESLATDFAAFSKTSADRASTAAQAMMATTSPKDLLEVQADYARSQVEANIVKMVKVSEAVIRTTREALSAHYPSSDQW